MLEVEVEENIYIVLCILCLFIVWYIYGIPAWYCKGERGGFLTLVLMLRIIQ
jgi:uncharacterized ion transporter superfamily protein YfcC